ncbi:MULTISPECIES: glycine cleavage system protein GcvH [unclassified Actinomyces]|uniref:glycine cleavage system protein GcvH n=1 Tax=unclassified Actinomyces TaxID=2609248 RepID=UPI0020182787|nr:MULTISPECIES: glycine cleavage system protein GcvH [unclassified Actinomyces]MCL3776718.1 glycine cleavage system protein GcvH [Actinomyces sp. AC-20-1]MCL3790650.1 glycine cleavage system protein GcvH [Actinomyces sp. 187325]MCL3792032.1 glycine cleavage system protein GcvH [Actinomyces sp. 186855]MCL3795383.1 glycine cleavage system protein GcvH [Actinomyces sp. 217892]
MAQPVRPHLRYSADHEWLEDGEPARVGITAVAADALGEVVFVELPEAGSQVEAGEPCGELESTKSVSDLVAPASGTVVAVNEAVVEEPGTINEDPYGAGWLFTVEVCREGDLLSAQEYAARFGAVVVG